MRKSIAGLVCGLMFALGAACGGSAEPSRPLPSNNSGAALPAPPAAPPPLVTADPKTVTPERRENVRYVSGSST